MKIDNFRCELTDITAKKEALPIINHDAVASASSNSGNADTLKGIPFAHMHLAQALCSASTPCAFDNFTNEVCFTNKALQCCFFSL